MKKYALLTLTFVSLQTFQVTHTASFAHTMCNTLTSGSRAVAGYLFSKNGIKDLCAAYLTGMGITTLHEVGHALADKYFYGSPLDITIGANYKSKKRPFITVGPFKLGGFSPLSGYSSFSYNFQDGIPDNFPKTFAITSLAGPVFGFVASLGVFALLMKYTKTFYIAKAVSLIGLLNHTFGPVGIGAINVPGTDVCRVKKCMPYIQGHKQINSPSDFYELIA